MRALVGVALFLVGCAELTQKANERLAEKTYEADSDRCRQDHPPRSRALHECYERVDAKWHVDGGAP